MENEEEDTEEQGGGGFQVELLTSYLAFAKRALKPRWKLSLGILALGLALTAALFVYLPRTYSCTTVLMAQGSAVLDGRDSGPALVGASEMILKHSNLENLIRDTRLVQ